MFRDFITPILIRHKHKCQGEKSDLLTSKIAFCLIFLCASVLDQADARTCASSTGKDYESAFGTRSIRAVCPAYESFGDLRDLP